MATSNLTLKSYLKGTTREELKQRCQDKHLAEIALRDFNWRLLAPILGISETEEEEIEQNCSENVEEQKIRFFRKWKQMHGRKATYWRLCKAFFKVDNIKLVEKVREIITRPNSSSEDSFDSSENEDYPIPPPAKKRKPSQVQFSELQPGYPSLNNIPSSVLGNQQPLQGSFSMPCPSATPSSRLVELDSYGKYLSEKYNCKKPHSLLHQWPPTGKTFNLTMIHNKRPVWQNINDKHVQYLQEGDIYSYINDKPPVQLKDILALDDDSRKVVLIEGGPGIGKSTLAWDVCQKWKEGQLFQEFKLVNFIDLQDPRIKSAKSLADILFAGSEERRVATAKLIKAHEGKGVLFVIDGWDEAGLGRDSFIHKLVFVPDELELPYSTLLITSRPQGANELYQVASSKMEIVGFSPCVLSQFFQEALKEDPNMQAFQDQLKQLTIINNMCYVPLNATIVVKILGQNIVNCSSDEVLSTLIWCYVYRHLTKKSTSGGHIPDIKPLDKIPPQVQIAFLKVCVLAYKASKMLTPILHREDLETYQLSLDDTLGLMQCVQGIRSEACHFVHGSVQMFLAAMQIPKFRLPPQVQLLPKLRGCEIGHVFQHNEYWTSLTCEEEDMKQQMKELIFCLYKDRDPSVCSFVALLLDGHLDLGWVSLNFADCQCIGYFIRCVCFNSKRALRVTLSGCSLDEHSFDGLLSELSAHQHSHTVLGSLDLDLTTNLINGNRLHLLVNNNFTAVHCLNLWGNSIQDRLLSLCQALQTNQSLVKLQLSACDLKITEKNGPNLVDMLRNNKTLKTLYLGWNSNIGDAGMHYIAQGLGENTTVCDLGLRRCGLREEGARYIKEVLRKNRTLKFLEISDNHLGDCGVKEVIEGLQSNHSLNELCIMQCSVSLPQLKEIVLCLKESQLKTLRVDGKDIEALAGVKEEVNEVRRQHGREELEIKGVIEQVEDSKNEDSSITGLEGEQEGTNQTQEEVEASVTNLSMRGNIGVMDPPPSYTDFSST